MVGLQEDDKDVVESQSLQDVALLAWTYPWYRRPFTWLFWHLPVVKWIASKVYRENPYRKVVGKALASAITKKSRNK